MSDRFRDTWVRGSTILLSLWDEMGIEEEALAERLDRAYEHLSALVDDMVT